MKLLGGLIVVLMLAGCHYAPDRPMPTQEQKLAMAEFNKQQAIEFDLIMDELEAKTLDGYNDLGLVPPEDTGTFSSPILVPSRRACRAVGYVDPQSHAVFWFNIHNDGNTYYIKDLGLFFKMLHIPDEEAFAAHH